MPLVVISNGPSGCDTFRMPQKTICNPEPDGPSGPGTTKLAQRTGDPPKPVSGSLTYPLDAKVTAVGRRRGLGGGRASSQLKSAGSVQEQTCQKRILDAFPVGRSAPVADRRGPRGAPGPRWVV